MVDPLHAERGGLLAELERSVQERPYPMLVLGLLAGYVAGGGLFSPLTRPLARAVMGALLVPSFRESLRGLAADLTPAETTGAA